MTQEDKGREGAIDWSRPIEAVHEDGRVVAAFVDWRRSPDVDGDHWLALHGGVGSYCAGDDDDRISPIAEGWRIRNVAQPTCKPRTAPSTVEVGPEVTERAIALVRWYASGVPGLTFNGLSPYAEAKAIVALLPEPVDHDEAEAQRLAEEGPCNRVEVILAGIKRGRALEKEAGR